MSKKKAVIELPMKNQKSRANAMKIAVGVPGVKSVAIGGDSKDQIEVTGEGMDSVKLTTRLRKKFCYANLVSFVDVEKKEEKKEEKKKEEGIVAWPQCVPCCNYPVYEIRNLYQNEDPYSCSIM